jgi:hypothetical protein
MKKIIEWIKLKFFWNDEPEGEIIPSSNWSEINDFSEAEDE